MGAMIERWERRITAAGPDVAPGVSQEELAQFRGRVSNPDNVRQFLEYWEGEKGDVEEGLGEGGEGEWGDDDSDNLEIVISDDEDCHAVFGPGRSAEPEPELSRSWAGETQGLGIAEWIGVSVLI